MCKHTHLTNYETPLGCCVRTSRTKPNYLQARKSCSFPIPYSWSMLFLPLAVIGTRPNSSYCKVRNSLHSTFSQLGTGPQLHRPN